VTAKIQMQSMEKVRLEESAPFMHYARRRTIWNERSDTNNGNSEKAA